MTQEELRHQSVNVEKLLQDSYELVKYQNLDDAVQLIEKALTLDFENEEVVSALKYANFWRDRRPTLESLSNDFEKGDYLLNQWKIFEDFVDRVGIAGERAIHAFRRAVYGEALIYFKEVSSDLNSQDLELLMRIGRCYKGKGEYDNALKYLTAASRERKDDPQILAELADCYALTNDEQKAKVFFREAFFLGAGKIDLSSIESGLVRRLMEKLKEIGLKAPFLQEWLPVYAVIFGVFNVKRELRSIEYGKLRQSIYSLEREINEGNSDKPMIIPRLINRYFWLIDHYVNMGEDRAKIEGILKKIQELDTNIYHQYTN